MGFSIGIGKASLKNTYIGMDVDDHEVRAIEVDLSFPIPKVCAFGRILLESGTIVDGIVKNVDLLADKLKELCQSNNFLSDKVILGIGNQDILIRFENVPKMQPNLIKNFIRIQSQDYFPVSINDYEMDVMKLSDKSEDGKDTTDILMVAAKNSLIKGYTQALEKASLLPYDIDISSLSIMKYATNQPEDHTVIIASIGYGKLDLLITKNSLPVFAKTTYFNPSGMLVKEIVEDNNTDSLDTLFLEISNEVKSLVNYCFTMLDSEPASSIIICGPGARVNGLLQHISTSSRTNTFLIDAFRDVTMQNDIKEKINSSDIDFAVCLSLALKGLEV